MPPSKLNLRFWCRDPLTKIPDPPWYDISDCGNFSSFYSSQKRIRKKNYKKEFEKKNSSKNERSEPHFDHVAFLVQKFVFFTSVPAFAQKVYT